ncbi:hypothetical protein Q8A67_022220 [Cirrhinus molitorella]|uniref:Uncharacterized protein n=1 Tax=Cirrhinus molitorella TaxID=172907 RepID=A0AA88P649_9TELE|nr:hypothetical protein Q8A67_022220 [Cirrhinus molitorella]
MHRSQTLCCVCVCVLLSVCCRAFELQDTIHALIEENIHLHDQLENLTRALRELRQLLFQHSDGTGPAARPSSAGLDHITLMNMMRNFSISGRNGHNTASHLRPTCCWNMLSVDMTSMAPPPPVMDTPPLSLSLL